MSRGSRKIFLKINVKTNLERGASWCQKGSPSELNIYFFFHGGSRIKSKEKSNRIYKYPPPFTEPTKSPFYMFYRVWYSTLLSVWANGVLLKTSLHKIL